jgi:hypothetical protein
MNSTDYLKFFSPAAGLLMGNDYEDPSKSAMPYFNKIPGEIKPYYQPYMDAGKRSLGDLEGQYGNLTNNPGEFINKVGEGFHSSPGYEFARQQAEQAAGHAAAAGGMAGSPQHEQQIADLVSKLASSSYGDWLNNALGAYQTGLTGKSHLNDMGYNASNEYATDIGNNLGAQGQLAYSGAANQNMNELGEQGFKYGLIGNALKAFSGTGLA